MKYTVLILVTILLSINSYSYTALDLLDFLGCMYNPTHVVTGEPLYCETWDLDGD